jgi:dipeptidyl aminopeptidase/acylaminoacyl peptidase
MQGSASVPFSPRLSERTALGGLPDACKSTTANGERQCAGGSSSARVPIAPELLPLHFPAKQLVTPQMVVFPASDGLQIHGQWFLPKNARPGDKLPTILFFHGGSRRQMLLGFNPMQYYAQTYELNQYFVSRGYAVLSVNYRSGTGYGMEFRQAAHYGAFGGSEYLDVEGAVKWLKAQANVDTRRIGAWGGSYGGYLTALALARDSADFAAGVDLHGVHDWSYELDLWKPTDDPDHNTAAAAAVAFKASPMADVNKWKSPVLLMQGDDDRNVLFGQTVRLAAALRANGVDVEEKIFPDEVHDFLLHKDWVKAYELAADFFDRKLKNR